MIPYTFPEHVPFEPQPDWITDTQHEEIDMTPHETELFEQLMDQLNGVIDTVGAIQTCLKERPDSQAAGNNSDEINTLKMMLETEKERANTAEKKLNAVLGALNG